MTLPLAALWLDADAVGRMLSYRPTKNSPAIAMPTSTAQVRSNTFGARARTSRSRSTAFIAGPRGRDAASATRRAS